MKINNYITYIETPEDAIYLRSKLLPVNIRLFNSSVQYRAIVLHCCSYIRWLALTKPEDYKQPHGMSGANAAIPFNIIGIVRNRGTKNAYCDIMMNPEITRRTGPVNITSSNCGSIRLEKPIEVPRSNSIIVTYYTENGSKRTNGFIPDTGSYTVQHEVDHNLGKLITDY